MLINSLEKLYIGTDLAVFWLKILITFLNIVYLTSTLLKLVFRQLFRVYKYFAFLWDQTQESILILFYNLFLFYYEWHYINNLQKENIISAGNFCHAFRFIDVLTTINNKSSEKLIRNIYPAELELKKETQIDKSDNFLDLNTKILYNRF